MDHIKSGKEFPEWMQNKLSKLHGQMESLHSALGEHGEDDDEEEMKEAISNNMKLISKIKNSGVVKTGSMSKDTKPAPKKEVDEAKRKSAPKMTGDYFAMQRAKDAAHNKAMGRTQTGRKAPERTMTSTQRSLASLRK